MLQLERKTTTKKSVLSLFVNLFFFSLLQQYHHPFCLGIKCSSLEFNQILPGNELCTLKVHGHNKWRMNVWKCLFFAMPAYAALTTSRHLWQPFESWTKMRNTKARPGELNSVNGEPVSGTAVNINIFVQMLSILGKETMQFATIHTVCTECHT